MFEEEIEYMDVFGQFDELWLVNGEWWNLNCEC